MTYDGPWPAKGNKPDKRRLLWPHALKAAGGNQSAAARAVGCSIRTAQRWTRELRDGTLLRRFDEHGNVRLAASRRPSTGSGCARSP